jgi:glycine cleavage system aminomethyltransferase T
MATDPLLSFRGPTVTEFLEYLTPSSLNVLSKNSSTLSVFMLPSGGILDDTMITRHSSDTFYIVTNAGRREEDLEYFAKQLKEWNMKQGPDKVVQHEILEGWGLVALQGPKAAEYLQGFIDSPKEAELISDLKELTFGRVGWAKISGKKVHIARGGYTGEDGFEVRTCLQVLHSVPKMSSRSLCDQRIPPTSPSTCTSSQCNSPVLLLAIRCASRLDYAYTVTILTKVFHLSKPG